MLLMTGVVRENEHSLDYDNARVCRTHKTLWQLSLSRKKVYNTLLSIAY